MKHDKQSPASPAGEDLASGRLYRQKQAGRARLNDRVVQRAKARLGRLRDSDESGRPFERVVVRRAQAGGPTRVEIVRRGSERASGSADELPLTEPAHIAGQASYAAVWCALLLGGSCVVALVCAVAARSCS